MFPFSSLCPVTGASRSMHMVWRQCHSEPAATASITERGYLGVAPWRVQEKDLVVVVSGAIVPFISCNGEHNHSSLLGEAYVNVLTTTFGTIRSFM